MKRRQFIATASALALVPPTVLATVSEIEENDSLVTDQTAASRVCQVTDEDCNHPQWMIDQANWKKGIVRMMTGPDCFAYVTIDEILEKQYPGYVVFTALEGTDTYRTAKYIDEPLSLGTNPDSYVVLSTLGDGVAFVSSNLEINEHVKTNFSEFKAFMKGRYVWWNEHRHDLAFSHQMGIKELAER